MVILHRTSWEATGEKEEEVNLQIIWLPARIKSGRPVLRQVARGSGKPLVLSLSWFPALLFIQTLISQPPHNAFTKQSRFTMHSCCCSVVLLWLPSNKRNLVEVQLEKSKLAVGHFDNLHQLNVQQHSFAFVPPSETVNSQRVKQSCLSSSQTPPKERILSTQFCFRTIIPHVGTRVGWVGDPCGAGMARRPAFLLTHVVVWTPPSGNFSTNPPHLH